MLITSNGDSPVVHPTARVAADAIVSGDVHIGPNSSIGHGVVLVAEGGPIRIGAHCVIMDTAVIRGVPGHVTRLGDHVMVGPRATLAGCEVEDEVFVATGASVFNGAVLGRGSEVRINALVHLRTVLAPGATVPIGWVAVGDPAQLFPASDHEGIWAVQRTLDFPGYVFKTDRATPDDAVMRDLMTRYARALLRMHEHDHVAP